MHAIEAEQIDPQKSITYASYLNLDQVLNAQTRLSDEEEHDEMLFIIIHQVYELWFKQILYEIDHMMKLLSDGNATPAMKTIKRILKILKTIVAQIDVLETMSPLEFNAFRSYLASSSGFQSYQFRELEFILGYKRRTIISHFSENSPGRVRVEKRYQEPTLWDALMMYLARQGYTIPEAILQRDITQAIEPSKDIRHIFIDIYRNDPSNAMLCELFVDLDEGIQEWRYRHVKMVERTIGAKQGTGGSTGAAYLHTTLQPFFADLWAIRAEL